MTSSSAIDTAVAGLDAWLETMRGPHGYGGPVAHWWQQNFTYTGAGLDWRYEGIVTGYLELWRRSGDDRWLAKARRAGDDMLRGHLADGHYAASAFEMNPASAGTPHEAACDVGLLSLALALRDTGDAGWKEYAAVAERNLATFHIGQLWDSETRSFRDSPRAPSFVANKAATTCEALFLLAELTGVEMWADRYALPTLDRILAHQIQDDPSLAGAIAQSTLGRQRIEKYFPIYIARCIPPLLRGYRWTGDDRYASCAVDAMRFIARWVQDDGSFPAVIYSRRRVNRSPCWIAALADILRAAEDVRAHGLDVDFSRTEQRLLAGQDASGGIRTASGFTGQAGGRPGATPDVRDVLHVVGWCDKAFRYLSSRVGCRLPDAEVARIEVACTFRDHALRLIETPELLEIAGRDGVCYRWRKGAQWPEVVSSEFWLH